MIPATSPRTRHPGDESFADAPVRNALSVVLVGLLVGYLLAVPGAALFVGAVAGGLLALSTLTAVVAAVLVGAAVLVTARQRGLRRPRTVSEA